MYKVQGKREAKTLSSWGLTYLCYLNKSLITSFIFPLPKRSVAVNQTT